LLCGTGFAQGFASGSHRPKRNSVVGSVATSEPRV